jgi:hypothetical protein
MQRHRHEHQGERSGSHPVVCANQPKVLGWSFLHDKGGKRLGSNSMLFRSCRENHFCEKFPVSRNLSATGAGLAAHEKWRGVSAPFRYLPIFPVDRGSLVPEQEG